MSLIPFFSDEIIQESRESQLKLEQCEKFASDDGNFENVEDFATRLVLWNSLQINPLPLYLEELEPSVGTNALDRTEDLDMEVSSEFDFAQAKLKQKTTELEDLKFLIQKSSEVEIEPEIIENETKKQKQKGSVITDGKQLCGIDLILNSQVKGLKYKNRNSKVLHPNSIKLFENPEDAFKHLCDGCSEVFETKGLYPLSTWCPHCSKGIFFSSFLLIKEEITSCEIRYFHI